MRSLIKDKSIYLLLLVTFLICATGLSVDSVRWRTTGDNSGWVSIFQSILFLTSLFVAFLGASFFKDRIITAAWVFSSFCFLFSVVRLDDWSIRSLVVMTFNVFSPPLGISYGKYLIMHTKQKKQDVSLLLLQIPTLVVGFMLLSINGKFDSDCSFAFFSFLPLIFFFRNDYLKLLFLAFYGVLILLAGKRSSTIAYIICVFIYLFYYIVIQTSHRRGDLLKKASLFIAAIIAFIFLYRYFSSQVQSIIERFRLIEDDGGSGRNEIYRQIIDESFRGNSVDLLFGHGYSSVLKHFEIGAHNDFLEVLYDYGIFALFLYIILLFRIVARWFHFTKKTDKEVEFSYVLLVNFVIILVLGMLNCMITSTYFNFVNYLALGATLQSLSLPYSRSF